MNALDRTCIEIVPSRASALSAEDEFGFLKDAKVLHDRRPVKVTEMAAQVTRGTGPFVKQVQYAPAIGAGQRLEYLVVPIACTGLRSFSHALFSDH